MIALTEQLIANPVFPIYFTYKLNSDKFFFVVVVVEMVAPKKLVVMIIFFFVENHQNYHNHG